MNSAPDAAGNPAGSSLLNPALSAKLVAAVDNMPAFPKSVRRILELTRDVNCAPKDLVQVIGKDPVVTVKVLRVVNSAYYSLAKPITSIDHAVVYLGFNTIKNLSLSIAAIGMLPAGNAAGFDGLQYLIHSLSTASIAKQLALRVGDADPMDCFMVGLLHDFGKVVFAQFMPREFCLAMESSLWNEIPLCQTLHQIVGTDHAVVGAMLVEKWRFPEEFVQTIRYQFSPHQHDTTMMACVFAANQVAKKLGFGYAGNPCIEELPASVALCLGHNLDTLIASLGNLDAVLDEATKLAHI